MISGVKKSEKEYRQLDRLSSSNIRTYATHGRKDFFKQVIQKIKSEGNYNRAMKIGTLAHCKILEPEQFDKKFYPSICESVPTGNMLKFVEALFKHTVLNTEDGIVTRDFKYLADLAYKDSEYSLKLETVLKRFKGEPENYYRELRECSGTDKEVACMDDVNIAEKIKEKVLSHEFTKHIFEESSEYEYINEYQIEEFDFHDIPMKAMVDRLKIDHENKSIQPYDLKIVWDNEGFFKEYFLKQRADIQGFIYDYALVKEFPGYTVHPIQFIVADSTNFNSPLIYPTDSSTLIKSWMGFTYDKYYYKGIRQILEEIKWYQESGNWNTSYEAFKASGIIKINI